MADHNQDKYVDLARRLYAMLDAGVRNKKLDPALSGRLRATFTEALKTASDLATFWQNKATDVVRRSAAALEEVTEAAEAHAVEKSDPSSTAPSKN